MIMRQFWKRNSMMFLHKETCRQQTDSSFQLLAHLGFGQKFLNINSVVIFFFSLSEKTMVL